MKSHTSHSNFYNTLSLLFEATHTGRLRFASKSHLKQRLNIKEKEFKKLSLYCDMQNEKGKDNSDVIVLSNFRMTPKPVKPQSLNYLMTRCMLHKFYTELKPIGTNDNDYPDGEQIVHFDYDTMLNEMYLHIPDNCHVNNIRNKDEIKLLKALFKADYKLSKATLLNAIEYLNKLDFINITSYYDFEFYSNQTALDIDIPDNIIILLNNIINDTKKSNLIRKAYSRKKYNSILHTEVLKAMFNNENNELTQYVSDNHITKVSIKRYYTAIVDVINFINYVENNDDVHDYYEELWELYYSRLYSSYYGIVKQGYSSDNIPMDEISSIRSVFYNALINNDHIKKEMMKSERNQGGKNQSNTTNRFNTWFTGFFGGI